MVYPNSVHRHDPTARGNENWWETAARKTDAGTLQPRCKAAKTARARALQEQHQALAWDDEFSFHDCNADWRAGDPPMEGYHREEVEGEQVNRRGVMIREEEEEEDGFHSCFLDDLDDDDAVDGAGN